MERIRTEILPGVWLTALRTDKFKTAWLSVNLLTQLRRSTAARRRAFGKPATVTKNSS